MKIHTHICWLFLLQMWSNNHPQAQNSPVSPGRASQPASHHIWRASSWGKLLEPQKYPLEFGRPPPPPPHQPKSFPSQNPFGRNWVWGNWGSFLGGVTTHRQNWPHFPSFLPKLCLRFLGLLNNLKVCSKTKQMLSGWDLSPKLTTLGQSLERRGSPDVVSLLGSDTSCL